MNFAMRGIFGSLPYILLTLSRGDFINAMCSKPTERIDTHVHFVPPVWREALIKYGHEKPDGMPGIPEWNVDDHLEFMRKANISKSILSITSPGTNLDPNDPEQGRQLSRACNEYAAELKRQYPEKFGFWASLPLPDLQGSLEELNYALDVLDADGVAVMTNAHGTYLGDSSLDELYRVLDERKVRVFMHPTSPCIKEAGAAPRSAAPLSQYPNPTFEFFFDTARAVINLFYSGVVQRSPGITFMVCHAGGALPPMIDRFTTFSSILPSTIQVGKDEVIKAFNTQFYFDLAGIVFPDQIKGLLSYVDARRITYGSDYPFTPADVAIGLVKTAEVYVPQNFPDANDQDLVWKGNALRLLGGEEESDKV